MTAIDGSMFKVLGSTEEVLCSKFKVLGSTEEVLCSKFKVLGSTLLGDVVVVIGGSFEQV
jgi:hypothetical protein